MKILPMILGIILIAMLVIPIASGLQQLENETDKSGKSGTEVKYSYNVRNDRYYSVDISVEILDYQWEVVVDKTEILNVPRNSEATFIFTVFIPSDSNVDESATSIRLLEREHKPIIDDRSSYDIEFDDKLITHQIDSSETLISTEMIENNPYIISFLAFSSIIVGYLWYGRKYYFLAPFYMTIPKEKLLNNENREKISHYLSQYNGSNLSEISQGTGIHLQTLRHHMKLFEQSEIVLKKDKRFFMRKPGSKVFDTEVLSPVLQRVFEIIRDSDGISVTKLVENTKRSKPWIGNRINDLIILDLIEIVTIGRYKYIYPKGQSPEEQTKTNNSTIYPTNS